MTFLTQLYRNESPVLAHWTYTQEEWKKFLRWKKLQKGVVHYLLHRLRFRAEKAPAIMIMQGRVLVDEVPESFHGENRRLKRIHIKDAGSMNVMEIVYQNEYVSGTGSNEIHLPVPKGRLKEAIRVEEALSSRLRS